MAVTRTFTRTEPRLSFVRIQLLAILRSSDCATSGVVERVRKGLEVRPNGEAPAIERVSLYAMDSDDRCWAELTIRVDWVRHRLQIEVGNAEVELNPSWDDKVVPEVDEARRDFDEVCRARGLRRDWSVGYRPGIDRAAINSELGFVSAKPKVWAGTPHEMSLTAYDVDEVGVTYRVV